MRSAIARTQSSALELYPWVMTVTPEALAAGSRRNDAARKKKQGTNQWVQGLIFASPIPPGERRRQDRAPVRGAMVGFRTTISQNLRGSRNFPFPHLTHLTHLTLVAALPRWVD